MVTWPAYSQAESLRPFGVMERKAPLIDSALVLSCSPRPCRPKVGWKELSGEPTDRPLKEIDKELNERLASSRNSMLPLLYSTPMRLKKSGPRVFWMLNHRAGVEEAAPTSGAGSTACFLPMSRFSCILSFPSTNSALISRAAGVPVEGGTG